MRQINPPEFSLTSKFFQQVMEKFMKYGEMPSPVTGKGLYGHWEKIRYLPPPDGLTAEDYWRHLKFARLGRAQMLPFTDVKGKHFWFCQIDQLLEFQHWLDKRVTDVIGAVSPKDLRINGKADEAIHSSMLEGAVTTREEARKILNRAKPPPPMSAKEW